MRLKKGQAVITTEVLNLCMGYNFTAHTDDLQPGLKDRHAENCKMCLIIYLFTYFVKAPNVEGMSQPVWDSLSASFRDPAEPKASSSRKFLLKIFLLHRTV